MGALDSEYPFKNGATKARKKAMLNIKFHESFVIYQVYFFILNYENKKIFFLKGRFCYQRVRGAR